MPGHLGCECNLNYSHLHHAIALLSHTWWYCSLLPSIKLNLRIYTVFQGYCFPSSVWKTTTYSYICKRVWVYFESYSCSPQSTLNWNTISMAPIIFPELDKQYVIVKQVTALSTSNLRLIIQDHFLIVLVFWHTLTTCELSYFPPPYSIISCAQGQLYSWPLFHCNKGRNSLLLLEWMLMRL